MSATQEKFNSSNAAWYKNYTNIHADLKHEGYC
jgi:hypothetical protein